jgi:hypothetical protein
MPNPGMFWKTLTNFGWVLIRAYLGSSLKPTTQNDLCIFLFIAILCEKISRVYSRGGQTFLFAGQIWQLFFIAGRTFQNKWWKLHNFFEAGKNLVLLTKFLVVEDLHVAFSHNIKRSKGRKNKLEGRTLATPGL